MASRVNLNVPPRLIESARAAQYANREAQGARELVRKIKDRTQQQREAAKRAQPQAQTADGRGGVFDAPAIKRAPRIWRKRRPLAGVDVGVGWLHIGQNYTINSETFESNIVIGDITAGWDNGSPYDDDTPNTGITTRRFEYTWTGSASVEFVITVGIGSGETWKQVRHTVELTGSQSGTGESSYNYATGFFFGDQYTANGSNNFRARLLYSLFPAGGSSVVLVVSIAQYSVNWGPGNLIIPIGSYVLQNTRVISFLITQSDIIEFTHPLPTCIEKRLDAYSTPVFSSFSSFLQFDVDNPDVMLVNSFTTPTQIGYKVNLPGVSSVIYETITSDGAFDDYYSPQQAKASYTAFSGNSEIPVLGYKRDNPLAASTPTTEKGFFGIIPGASVTAPVTAEMRAADLDDELEQKPGPNAENRPEPVDMIVAYDYHGGTYCRDQLAALGIALP